MTPQSLARCTVHMKIIQMSIAELSDLLFYLQMTPRLLHKLSNKCVTTISVGAEFSVAMDTAGYMWVWGRADSGQVSEAGLYMSTTSK